jgi:serine/threonine protein kinase
MSSTAICRGDYRFIVRWFVCIAQVQVSLYLTPHFTGKTFLDKLKSRVGRLFHCSSKRGKKCININQGAFESDFVDVQVSQTGDDDATATLTEQDGKVTVIKLQDDNGFKDVFPVLSTSEEFDAIVVDLRKKNVASRRDSVSIVEQVEELESSETLSEDMNEHLLELDSQQNKEAQGTLHVAQTFQGTYDASVPLRAYGTVDISSVAVKHKAMGSQQSQKDLSNEEVDVQGTYDKQIPPKPTGTYHVLENAVFQGTYDAPVHKDKEDNVKSDFSDPDNALPVDAKSCLLDQFKLSPHSELRGNRLMIPAQHIETNQKYNVFVFEPLYQRQFVNEVSILVQLNEQPAVEHQHMFPTLHGFCEDSTWSLDGYSFEKSNYYIAEESGNETLGQLFNRVNGREAAQSFFWIVESLLKDMAHLHEHGIVYLNYHTDTLFIQNNSATNVLLADFSHAKTNPSLRAKDVRNCAKLFQSLYERYIRPQYPFLPRFGFHELLRRMLDAPSNFDAKAEMASNPFFTVYGSRVLSYLEPELSTPECNFSEFTLLRELASGVDGSTYIVRDVLGKERVLKVQGEGSSSLLEEITILETLKGQFIAPDIICRHLRGGFDIPSGKRKRQHFEGTAFVMTKIEGDTLESFWFGQGKVPFKTHYEINVHFRKQMRRMIKVLIRLNEAGIYHLDTHTRNWILDPKHRLQLIDFSRARPVKGERFDVCGRAPEIDPAVVGTNHFGHCQDYDGKSEVYILGAALKNLYDRLSFMARGVFKKPSQDLTKLLLRMMEDDKKDRPSLKELLYDPALHVYRYY